MRSVYPLSSNELNDKLLESYQNLVYLLGYEEDNESVYSGVYDRLESSGNAMLISQSGIPNYSMLRMKDLLKFDYIYRKHYEEIQYLENDNGRQR